MDNGFLLLGSGTPGAAYGIEATTTLTGSNWIRLITVPADEHGVFQFLDETASLSQPFCRARVSSITQRRQSILRRLNVRVVEV